jgi:sugar lactone lactonase YvrE
MEQMNLEGRQITDGLRFPEGPIALADGSVLVVEIEGARLIRVAPDGLKEVERRRHGTGQPGLCLQQRRLQLGL